MNLTVRDIENAVCERFKVSKAEIRSRLTTRRVVRPRQIAMFLAREMTQASLPLIGSVFNRDHTTVLYGQRKIARLMRESNELPAHVQDVRDIVASAIKHRDKIGALVRGGAQ